jgi:hypothetical protein
MASEPEFEEIEDECGSDYFEDTVSALYCTNCKIVHLDICEGDWSCQITMGADAARRLAAHLLAAADQMSPADKQLVH